MEWSIHQLARSAGVTSRALRHYDAIGLLTPSRVAPKGYRFYDDASLVRLQRILLLRELGLGLTAIARVLDQQEASTALQAHLAGLLQERDRLDRQITSVQTTLHKLTQGEELMANEVFDGFDHTTHQAEVIERWGEPAYQRGDSWWRALSPEQRKAFQQEQADIATAYAEARRSDLVADDPVVQEITGRHVAWLARTMTPSKDYLLGLGELYVTDERFTANYDKHYPGTAQFVRAALATYAEARWP